MFKLEINKNGTIIAYRATNTKTSGAFRVETYIVFGDDNGIYVLKRKKKVYLTGKNCSNLFDNDLSVEYNKSCN